MKSYVVLRLTPIRDGGTLHPNCSCGFETLAQAEDHAKQYAGLTGAVRIIEVSFDPKRGLAGGLSSRDVRVKIKDQDLSK